MSKFFSRSFFLLFFCFFIQNISYATHIVGGEILYEWTGNGNQYRIVFNKYINEISVRQYGFVTNATEYIAIYDKATNTFIEQVKVYLISNTLLSSNSSYCTNPALVETSMQVYMAEFNVGSYDPNRTYYMTWYDCCRNQDIVNLSSPSSEGVALYTEFNRFWSGGARNNSPKFVPLANEFFCKNNINVINLGATDSDGDALVYSLVSPRSSIVPSTDVVWSSGRSAGNPIPGSMPFTIDPSSGVTTFNPSAVGIYAFGVKVEEFRNGLKIGEVRKDFQLNVQDCPQNNKPVIAFKNRAIKDSDTLAVSLRGSTCFPIYITDIDATQLFISETIFINAHVTPSPQTNASYPTTGFTLPTQLPLTGFRDTARFDACFDPCAGGLRLNQSAYYPFKIIINDNRCPAQYDTLTFTIKIEVGNNTLPEVFIDPPTNPISVKVNEQVAFKVYGTDADQDDLLTLNLANPQRDMHFTNVRDSSLTISSNFSWTPNCNDLSPGMYDVYFIIKDNSCMLNPSDTVRQTIIVTQDEVSFNEMQVTNLITPNGDGLNDYYQIPGIPVGNCDKYFKGIEIYNRWGSRVFYSQDRLFKWYPDVSDGMYYFSIDLNYEVRKGWLQITE